MDTREVGGVIFDYDALFARGRRGGAVPTFAAPMEGLGDARFRIALAANGKGGFDEACREFIRVCLLYTSPSPRD